MVLSESSGVCVSLDAQPGSLPRRPSTLVRGCWGLAGGIGGRTGSARIASDVVHVDRPAVAADPFDDDARVETEIAQKNDQLKLDDAQKPRMSPVSDHLKRECCVSPVQARMIAKEALRLEAAFLKPQVMSWAFAGRLLHILDVEPLLVPVSRIESDRQRTWDERLLPAGLLAPTTPLTFSVWQRAAARGVERAGRILGVKGVILEDTRPQMPRLLGYVSGRVYGNVEVLTALLDLLPFADKARAALAAATGQSELVPRKAPPPGFWQRQRQKLGVDAAARWPGQLEKLSEIASLESERYRGEVEAAFERLRGQRIGELDPDMLVDVFDELEDALSKIVAALVLSGMVAMLYKKELDDVVAESELSQHPGLANDLLGGEIPGDLVDLSRKLFALVDLVRRRAPLRESLEAQRGKLDQYAAHLLDSATRTAELSDDERRLSDELRALLRSPSCACTGELTIENARSWERPDAVLDTVLRLVPTSADADTVDALARASHGARRKAEYKIEELADHVKGGVRKRFATALDGVRKHGRDASLLWMPAERAIDRLHVIALAVGDRLFEHGLLDQPRDVLHLTTPELSGLVRGTGVDQDGKSIVASRKRQAAARPLGLPRRLETKGVVATSLLRDDDDEHRVTAPGEAREVSGRSVAAGDVNEPSVLLDGNPLFGTKPQVPSGVVVVRALTLANLPLLLVARAVVAERGTIWGPAAYALRALGVPTVVDAPQATAAFSDGEPLHVDAARGTVKRVTKARKPAEGGVDPHVFAREAVLSDPRGRVRASRPAQPFSDLPQPPVVSPRGVSVDDYVLEPKPRLGPPGSAPFQSDEDFALMPGEQTKKKRPPVPLEDAETDDEKTDFD
jgi:pyruvate,water dikinase